MKEFFSIDDTFSEDKLQKKFKQLSDISNYQDFRISKISNNTSLEKSDSNTNISLLIIDDEELSLDTFSYLLKLRGYNVFTATNINEGLKIYQDNDKIDLIILNIQLSSSDYRFSIPGLFSINNDTKIIGISHNLSKDDLPAYFKSILYGFLNKPFLLRELLKIINNMKNSFSL